MPVFMGKLSVAAQCFLGKIVRSRDGQSLIIAVNFASYITPIKHCTIHGQTFTVVERKKFIATSSLGCLEVCQGVEQNIRSFPKKRIKKQW